MRFPWANIVILLLGILLGVTGYAGLVEGEATQAWILWLHGIGAYGLLVMLLWKGSIILDAWRRKTVWTRQRLLFALLLVLLLLTIAAGLLWTFYGPIYVGGFSLISLHMYLAVVVLLLMLWHGWQMRFIRRLPQTWGRRLFLGTAVSALSGLALWGAAERLLDWLNWPGAARRFTGSYERGSFGGSFPVVSWIADYPPPVDVDAWRLAVVGAVQRPLRLSYEELLKMANVEQTVTLDCTGGWYTTQVWRGVPLARLLEMAGATAEAESVTIEAVSGYRRRFSVAESGEYLLAAAVGERPLSHGHGFPLRLVAPGQRGVSWVKWVTRIQVNTTSKHWQLPLPLQ